MTVFGERLPDTPYAKDRSRVWYCAYWKGIRVEVTENYGRKVLLDWWRKPATVGESE